MIKKLPLPIAGVMLGLAALGNLIQSYSETCRQICGWLSIIIGVLIVVKFIMYTKESLKQLDNPIVLSVFCTFSMAIMILSTYAKGLSLGFGKFVYFVGLILHIILMICFTIKYIVKFDIKKVFTSYYIVYVGLVAASIAAPAFGLATLGQIIFWFGLITCAILIGVITYRYVKVKQISEPATPLIAIYAAPISLCLVGYISSFPTKNLTFVCVLAVLSFAFYIFGLLNAGKLVKYKFYPSFSAFTFPMVISAIAMKQTNMFLMLNGHKIAVLKYIVNIQTIIAVVLVAFVFIKYVLHLVQKEA